MFMIFHQPMETKLYQFTVFAVILWVSFRQDVQVSAQVGTVPESLLQFLYDVTGGKPSSTSVSDPVNSANPGPVNPPEPPASVSGQATQDLAAPISQVSSNVNSSSSGGGGGSSSSSSSSSSSNNNNNNMQQSQMGFFQEVMEIVNPSTTAAASPLNARTTAAASPPLAPPAPLDLGSVFVQPAPQTTAAPPPPPTTQGAVTDVVPADLKQTNSLWSSGAGPAATSSNPAAAPFDLLAAGPQPSSAAPALVPLPTVNRGPMGLNLDRNAIASKPPAFNGLLPPPPPPSPPPPQPQPQPHPSSHQQQEIHSAASNAILPPEIQQAAVSLGRRMGITQHYETHGCVDPMAGAPPGSPGPGLMFSCHHPQSEHVCETAGVLAGGSVSNMAQIMSAMSPGYQQTLEECLTPGTLNKLVAEMSSGNGRGRQGMMNPLMMASLMGGGGGSGSEMMMAMAMMGAMRRNHAPAARHAQTGGAGGLLEAYGQGPAAAAAAGNAGSTVMTRCMMVLPELMVAEGGLLSPEAVELIAEKRKQLLPYSCQDITAGFMPFRMCCPGKVPKPTVMDMMMSRTMGA